MNRFRLVCPIFIIAVNLVLVQFTFSQNRLDDYESQSRSDRKSTFDRLSNTARTRGRTRVIVRLKTETLPEGVLDESRREIQRSKIRLDQEALAAAFSSLNADITIRYRSIPFVAMTVDTKALESLMKTPMVTGLYEDLILQPALEQSTSIIGAPAAWSLGFDGSGSTVAVIDSGIDRYHPFLGNRIVAEACFGTNDNLPGFQIWESICPGGVSTTTAFESGMPCAPIQGGECKHGTHVGGIVAGASPSLPRFGVAPATNLIAIQVFSRLTQFDEPPVGETVTLNETVSLQINNSDIIRALEHVLTLANTTNLRISAANLSIAHSQIGSSSNCGTGSPLAAVVTNLKTKGIATVISSGNNGWKDKISYPSCVEPAISVGSTHDGSSGQVDTVSTFSNSAANLDLLAPGQSIVSSVPNGGYESKQGTSMAAPHVAGAMAVLKQRYRNASVDQMLSSLQSTGLSVNDSNGIARSRINVSQALASMASFVAPIFDFDGDDKTDIAVFRPDTQNGSGTWWIRNSTNGQVAATNFGIPTDRIVPGDYSGDSKTDIAVYRLGIWYVLRSENNTFYSVPLGNATDIAAPADFDGDLKTDVCVFRPSTGEWYVIKSATGATVVIPFGQNGDLPVAGDYDGDGISDTAIYRPSNGQWWLNRSTAGVAAVSFGTSGDKPVPANWTSDGRTDVAVWRPSDGTWYVLRSEDSSFYSAPFGLTGDLPVPGDYDADGEADVAVFRPSDSTWYINRSTAGLYILQFGSSTDQPVPGAYVP